MCMKRTSQSLNVGVQCEPMSDYAAFATAAWTPYITGLPVVDKAAFSSAENIHRPLVKPDQGDDKLMPVCFAEALSATY